jgi:hypothetical protein
MNRSPILIWVCINLCKTINHLSSFFFLRADKKLYPCNKCLPHGLVAGKNNARATSLQSA